MKNTTQAKAFKQVLTFDNADKIAIKTALELFADSKLDLDDFILEMDNAKQWNTGGGCFVSVLPLDNGKLFITTDENGGIFKDENDFWEYEGGKLELQWWYA